MKFVKNVSFLHPDVAPTPVQKILELADLIVSSHVA